MPDEPQAKPTEELKPEETPAPTPPAEPENDAPPAWDFTRSELKAMTPEQYQEKRADIMRANSEHRIKDDVSGNRGN